MQNKDEALGTQPIGKLMLSLALPAVAAQFINMLYNIVDRIYIGNIPAQRTCADGSGRYVPHHPAGLGLCRIRRNGRRAAGFHPAGRRQP